MRQMIEDVWDKCKEKNIDILCEVSDGQWIRNINHDIQGEPLSKLQFQKKIWKETMDMKKVELIQYLNNVSSISAALLKNGVMKINCL